MILCYTEKTRGLNVVITEVDEHFETDINGVFCFSCDTLKESFEELEKFIMEKLKK